jgi:hypothetical protein
VSPGAVVSVGAVDSCDATVVSGAFVSDELLSEPQAAAMNESATRAAITPLFRCFLIVSPPLSD